MSFPGVCLLLGALGAGAVTLDSLRCEYRVDPVGIGERGSTITCTAAAAMPQMR